MLIAEMLGGRRVLRRDVRNDSDLHDLIRSGIPATAVQVFAKRARLDRRACEQIVSSRHVRRTEILSPELSDRLARYARVQALAEETFSNPEKGTEWLHRPNRALKGNVPFDLLDTEAGARLVEDVLIRLAYGVFG